MKEIKIYGSTCPDCTDTKLIVQDVIKEHNIEAKVIRIEDINAILKASIFSIPAVSVNGEIVFEGACPTKAFLESVLVG